MWEDWQKIVEESLPNFCRSPIYVQQRSQTQEDFESAADYVAAYCHQFPHPLRDVEFGGVIRDTKACGKVTRMWLDSCVEADFIQRNLADKTHTLRVLEIGAGYGRLAANMQRGVRTYTCVDAVPISTEVCRSYTARFASLVHVSGLAEFVERVNSSEPPEFDLAINVHSWNECSYAQVERWLNLLRYLRVTYLFTVSNGHISGGKSAYATWGGSGNSFRPLLCERYTLVNEEEIGLSRHPHALWQLR